MDELLKQLHEAQCLFQDNIDLLSEIIEGYGSIEVSDHKPADFNNVTHDFLMFCLTKSIRSQNALDNLLTNGYGEDAFIITRSVYECYLNSAFVLHTPNRVNELVSAKVGIHAGIYKHPESNKGNPLTHKLIHPVSGNIVKYGVGFDELAANTGKSYDSKYHSSIYSFLSEFSHVHMITCGSFVNSEFDHFRTDTDPHNIYSSVILALFVSCLILDVALSYTRKFDSYNLEFDEHQLFINEKLKILLESIEYQDRLLDFKKYALLRLNE